MSGMSRPFCALSSVCGCAGPVPGTSRTVRAVAWRRVAQVRTTLDEDFTASPASAPIWCRRIRAGALRVMRLRFSGAGGHPGPGGTRLSGTIVARSRTRPLRGARGAPDRRRAHDAPSTTASAVPPVGCSTISRLRVAHTRRVSSISRGETGTDVRIIRDRDPSVGSTRAAGTDGGLTGDRRPSPCAWASSRTWSTGSRPRAMSRSWWSDWPSQGRSDILRHSTAHADGLQAVQDCSPGRAKLASHRSHGFTTTRRLRPCPPRTTAHREHGETQSSSGSSRPRHLSTRSGGGRPPVAQPIGPAPP